MTWKEIQNQVRQDSEFLDNCERRLWNEWERSSKKLRPFPLYFAKEVKSPRKNDYIIVAWCKEPKELRYQTAAIINTNNGKSYVEVDSTDFSSETSFKITSHTLKRFKERFIKKEISAEKTFAVLQGHTSFYRPLYTDKDNRNDLVYASKIGLFLATRDDEKKMMVFDTFISDDLLGPSQLIAKNKLVEIQEKYADNPKYRELLFNKYTPILQEIYDKYKGNENDYLAFRKLNETKDDNVKLNFKLKTTAEIIKNNTFNISESINPMKNNHSNDMNRMMFSRVVFGEKIWDIDYDKTFCGYGTLKSTKGFLYEGSIIEGKPEGYGELKSDTHFAYKGYWVRGQFSGKGKLSFDKDSFEEGEFSKNVLHGYGRRYACGIDGVGMWFHGEPHGILHMQSDDGFKYDGNLKYGKYHGKGILISTNGVIYDGTFKNGEFTGYGTQTYPKKKFKVTGTFKDFRPNGRIKVTFDNGTILEGRMENGDWVGKVKTITSEGEEIIKDF